MNNKGGRLHFAITADNEDVKRKLAETRQGIINSGKAAEEQGSKIEGMFKRAALAAGAFFTVQQAASFAKQIAVVRGEFQQLEVAFTTMLGSASKGKSMMQEAVEIAAKTPFDLKGVAQGAKQLLAYGSASQDVGKELVMLGNIAAGLSIPLNDMVYLYGTTQTQGRLFTQDMRQFMGRGIPLAEELAKQFGVTKQEINEMVTAGKVGFPEVQKALQSMTDEGGKFHNLMEAQSKTITGQISNLGDAIDVMFNNIGQSQEGIISGVIGGATSMVENYERVGKILVGLIAAYGTYKAAVMVAAATSKGYTIAQLAQYNALLATEKAQKLLNATMLKNPYVLAATLVIGVVAALWALHDGTTAAEKAQKRYNEAKEKAIQEEQNHKNKIDELIRSATDESMATLTRIGSLEELKKEYPKIFEKYDIEKLKLADILAIKKAIAEEDAGKKAQDNKDKVAELQSQYDKAKAEYDDFMSKKNAYGKTPNEGNLFAKALKKRVDIQAEALKLAQKDVQEDLTNDWIANVNKLTDKQIQAELAARQRLDAALGQNEKKGKTGNAIVKGGTLSGKFTADEIKEQSNALSIELEKRGAKLYSYAELVKKYNKDIVDAEKELADAKASESKLSEEDYKKLIADKNAKVEAAKKTKNDFDKDAKSNAKPKDYTDQLAKDAQEKERLYKDMGFRVRQGEIEGMDEGLERVLAQNELNYLKEIEQIKQQKEDKLAKIQEWERNIWEAQNPNWEKQGKIFTPQTTALSKVDEGQFDVLESSAGAKLTTDNKKALDDLKAQWLGCADEYQQIEDQITATKEKADKDRKNITHAVKSGKLTQEDGKTATAMVNTSEADQVANMEAAKTKLTAGWTQIFRDLEGMSRREVQVLIDEINKQLSNSKLAPADASALLEQLNKAKDYSIAKNPFASWIDGIGDVKTSTENLEAAKKKLAEVKANPSSSAKELKDAEQAKQAAEKSVADSKKQRADAASKSLGDVAAVASEVSGLLGTFGVESPAVDGVVNALGALASIDFTNPISVITGGLKAISSLLSGVFGESDKKKEKEIKKLQEQVDALADSYDKLGEAIDKAYSTDAANLIRQSDEMLRQQNEQIKKQKELEQSKKKPDKGAIDTYDKAIEENNKKLEENKEAARDAIFGSDVQSAIDDFANAYMDAWASGEDRAKAQKDVVKNMIRGIIQEMLKADIAKQVESMRQQIEGFMTDGALSDWELADIDKMGDEIGKIMEERGQLYDKILKDDVATEREASQKGFGAMSQDSADELNGRFTAIQGHTFELNENVRSMLPNITGIRESMNFIRDNAAQQLEALHGIRDNTARLESIEANMLGVKNGIEAIRDRGIILKK